MMVTMRQAGSPGPDSQAGGPHDIAVIVTPALFPAVLAGPRGTGKASLARPAGFQGQQLSSADHGEVKVAWTLPE
jgi:hypothetical protein